MNDIDLALITGVDIAIPQCQLVVHQPKLKEIALLGQDVFFSGVQCLNINVGMDESDLDFMSNFQIFMTVMLDKRLQSKRRDVEQALSLICPNYQATFIPNSFLLVKEGEAVRIDESNFDIFQNVISQMFCLKAALGDTFNPQSEKGREIAEKLMRARQRVAAQKGDEEAMSLATYASSLAIAQQLPLSTIGEYTVFQLYDALERYQLKLTWDLDLVSRFLGSKSESQDNWMKNIH